LSGLESFTSRPATSIIVCLDLAADFGFLGFFGLVATADIFALTRL
jgi:hypothetical protein